jgi:hypothetical protein
VFFNTIVVCPVTGSAQAGMAAGFAALASIPIRCRFTVAHGVRDQPARATAARDRQTQNDRICSARILTRIQWMPAHSGGYLRAELLPSLIRRHQPRLSQLA